MQRFLDGYNADNHKRAIYLTSDKTRVMVTSDRSGRILEALCLHSENAAQEQRDRLNLPKRPVPVIPHTFMELLTLRDTARIWNEREAACFPARADLLSEIANACLPTSRIEGCFGGGFMWEDGNYVAKLDSKGGHAPDMPERKKLAEKLAHDIEETSGIKAELCGDALVISPDQEEFRKKLIGYSVDHRLTVPPGLGTMHSERIEGSKVNGRLRERCVEQVTAQYDDGRVEPWRRHDGIKSRVLASLRIGWHRS